MIHRWALVLAGGEGERLKSFVREREGRPIPKQYCVFSGGKTMLERAYERAEAAVSPERIVTVVGRGHRAFLGRTRVRGRVIEQCANRGTLPGVLLGLAHILASDPLATVLILPSDHFIDPPEALRGLFGEAMGLAERYPDQLVLLAAVPDAPEPDYGWIEPGAAVAESAFSVRLFREKPDAILAREFFHRGYLWNTMITAAKGREFWETARALLPGLIRRFDALRAAAGAGPCEFLQPEVYESIAPADFSRDILERACLRCLVMPMRGARWSDWGRAARILGTLEAIGRRLDIPAGTPAPQAQWARVS